MTQFILGICTTKDAWPLNVLIHAISGTPAATNRLEPADSQKNLNRLQNR